MKKKSWKEFQESGLLWWMNRTLHLFGWAIVIQEELDGTISDVYPARVKFRGFDLDIDDKGFRDLSKYLKDNMEELEKEARLE